MERRLTADSKLLKSAKYRNRCVLVSLWWRKDFSDFHNLFYRFLYIWCIVVIPLKRVWFISIKTWHWILARFTAIHWDRAQLCLMHNSECHIAAEGIEYWKLYAMKDSIRSKWITAWCFIRLTLLPYLNSLLLKGRWEV